MLVSSKTRVRVADQVWVAVALLHREQPRQPDFAIDEIVHRVGEEGMAEGLRPGVYVHVVQHCVANRPPNPARYRMLFETRPGRRRLFRTGDPYHPAREGAKITPKMEDLPPRYRELLAWYGEWCAGAAQLARENDPLLKLAGTGKSLWAKEHADEYVKRLREAWD